MAMTKLLDGQTTAGTSTPTTVGVLKNAPRGDGSQLTIIVSGITTGEVQVQFGPTSDGPWLAASDGSGTITADDVLSSPASQEAYIRLEVTTATDVDIDAWAG